ncbi:hypothetical protein GCM10027155_05350 [Acinetobacter apis]|uniref:Uncharacterized protein n=2 Tax=Acinetobacter apis TaxID=1229165 RepID=A0A217EE97_9GAMM|nr:hypothetical protein SAMN05444584_0541 [Acinetobacter apis]
MNDILIPDDEFMLEIYLTDTQQHIQFQDYPGDHPVKFILNFKKIFPSVMELLLPVLPEDNNLEQMQWESKEKDFNIFKLFVSGWGGVELRLTAIAQYKDREYANDMVQKIKKKRQSYHIKHKNLTTPELDYLFLHDLHATIDEELIEVGERFYLPLLREQWKPYITPNVLNGLENVKKPS